MDASLMDRMQGLEEDTSRLKKAYAEERLKAEVIAEALEKSSKAISAGRDGKMCHCCADRGLSIRQVCKWFSVSEAVIGILQASHEMIAYCRLINFSCNRREELGFRPLLFAPTQYLCIN